MNNLISPLLSLLTNGHGDSLDSLQMCFVVNTSQ